ncbi:MAG TPA: protealysin inhibitor emfourin [Kineosporiaceae bacterium]|jgi:hypothetical protein|nr:protealysin inhibitor emfourin [Kineosporiaceae bacterium]
MTGHPEPAGDDPGRLRVRVERSGGFAGISRVWAVDTEDLEPDAAARLHRLVDAVQRAGAAGDDTPRPGAPGAPPDVPDAFGYRVTVARDSQTWGVSVREDQAAEPLRALIDHVRGVPGGS